MVSSRGCGAGILMRSVVWDTDLSLLCDFLQTLNNSSYKLKFSSSNDQQKITFLDIMIYVQEDRSLFRKASVGNTLWHATRFHPRPLVRLILNSRYLRLRWNCLSEDDLKNYKLRRRLLERGYTKSTLRKAYNKVRAKTRQSVLLPGPHKQVTSQVWFITGFSSQHTEVRKILEKHWELLLADAKVSNYVLPYPQKHILQIPVVTRQAVIQPLYWGGPRWPLQMERDLYVWGLLLLHLPAGWDAGGPLRWDHYCSQTLYLLQDCWCSLLNDLCLW